MKFLACLIVVAAFLVFSPVDVFAVNISSRSAMIIDVDYGEILFYRDIHTPRSPASMTKIVTAFITFEEIESGNLNMDTPVTISANAAHGSRHLAVTAGYTPLVAGSQHSVNTLLHLMMLPSSNGAAIALAEHIAGSEDAFVVRMNETITNMGLWSNFANPHGAVDHETTAYTIGRLVYEFIHRFPEILYITGQAGMTFAGRDVVNTNLLLRTRPFSGADGFKTGTTQRAGRCLAATATRDGRRIITVIMNAPSNVARYDDTIALLNYGFAEAARRDEIRAKSEAERLEMLRLEAEWNEFLQREAEASAIYVVVDDRLLEPANFPRIMFEYAMVPAREFLVAMRVIYFREQYGNILVRTAHGRTVLFMAGQDLIFVDNDLIESVTPQIVGDDVFIPIRHAMYALGFGRMRWCGDSGTVFVYTHYTHVHYTPEEIEEEDEEYILYASYYTPGGGGTGLAGITALSTLSVACLATAVVFLVKHDKKEIAKEPEDVVVAVTA